LNAEEGDGGWQRISFLFRAETASVLSFSAGLSITVAPNFHSSTSPSDGHFCFNNSSFYPALNAKEGDGG
jgi:hypothetical protein